MRPDQHDLIKQPQALTDVNKHIRDLTDRLREDLQEIPNTARKLEYFDFFIKTHIPHTLHDLAAEQIMSRGAKKYNAQDIRAAVAEIEAEGIIAHVKRLKAGGKDPGIMVIDAILREYDRVVFTKEIDAEPIQDNRERILWTEERIAELERCREKGLFSYKSIKAVEDGDKIHCTGTHKIHDAIGLLTAWGLQEDGRAGRQDKIIADNFTAKIGKRNEIDIKPEDVSNTRRNRKNYHEKFRETHLKHT